MRPVFLAPGSPPVFPDARRADREGLVAVGGDLSPPRLLAAYAAGIFPWFDDDTPPLWWSPDPRGVIEPSQVHASRRLQRRIRQGGFRVTWNRAFATVMRACARGRSDGTWITAEMLAAYTELHRLGHAHSVEVWVDCELAGGLYGVQVGGLFAAESMFHVRTDASKVALVHAVGHLSAAGIEVFDVQFATPHLRSMGATEWSRARYLAEVARVRAKPVDLGDPAS